MILKFGQSIKYYIEKIFTEEYATNINQKVAPDLHLILVNSLKYG